MDTRDLYKLVRQLSEDRDDVVNLYDSVDLELSEGFVIETGVVGFMEDGVIVHLDEDAVEFLGFNGVLLESEEVVKESYDNSPVYRAVLNRITGQHLDLLSKFGPAAVMAAVEDVADGVPRNLDEIGSSDVSIWTKRAIEYLEAGHYKHLHENAGGNIDEFKAKVSTSNDPFEMIYGAISGDYGDEIRAAMQEMYDDIVIDFRLHPDDDFEPIINKMLDYLDADAGDQIDELALIKNLAHGELNEQLAEAEYQGRKVQLNKPMAGDVKKSKVYVKKPDGKVVKVNFGDKTMRIKKSNPARRKSFRARHHCENPGPKWKARYWSCRAW